MFKMLTNEVRTNTTPIYLVRHANAMASDNNESDCISLLSQYIDKAKIDRVTRKINGGSDHAIKETEISGTDTSNARVPIRARSGEIFLWNSKPEIYRLRPKKRALMKLAETSGSTPNI